MRTKNSNDGVPSKSNGSRLKTQQGKAPETSQNQPQSAEKAKSRIPPPQSARIIGRFIAGDSIRKISREEKRDRETVRRIVRSNEVQLYILELRKAYFGLGQDAIDAIRKRLNAAQDGRLGHQVLTDIGVIPSAKEREVLLSGDSETGNLALDIVKQVADSIAEDGQDNEQDVEFK